jgi:hypothetical protein
MHKIRKGQLNLKGSDAMAFADRFYTPAGQIRPA